MVLYAIEKDADSITLQQVEGKVPMTALLHAKVQSKVEPGSTSKHNAHVFCVTLFER
jgi:hypothetical protein